MRYAKVREDPNRMRVQPEGTVVTSLILFPHGLPFQLYLFLYGLG